MPSGDISSETRNLTPLLVFRNGDPTITDLEPGSDKVDPNHQNIQDKIIAALKLLSFREPRVLVQFWSPHVAGKRQWLTTSDQPIGLGVIDAGLCSYRQDSERRCFVVEEEHEEEDRGPAARVFRRRLPEWTPDLDNYTPKQFPQQESAIRFNLHGYLALPVFDSNTQLCVGVLELLMSSKYKSYACEIQKIHGALKTQNLTSPQGLDISALYAENPVTPQGLNVPALNTENLITPQGLDFPALNTLITPQGLDFLALNAQSVTSPLRFEHPASYIENPIIPQELNFPALNTATLICPQEFDFPDLFTEDLISAQEFDFPDLYIETPISQQEFDFTDLYVPKESRQRDFEKIISILKLMCDIHSLPLAQTWAVSKHSSFVSHEKVIQKSCSSFDTRCVGKVCMSAADLPFHVKDPHMLTFKEACRMKHLDKSHGFVGKALSCRGSCFCGDVTKLCKEEYPLVQNARMHRLTSCFAVFLHSVEANDEYVLEFFLPPDIKDSGHVQNLVQTLKQNIEITSGFELGDTSCIQVVEPPMVVSKSSGIDPHTIQIASITTTNFNRVQTVTSDSESIVVYTDNRQSCPWDHEMISCLNVIQKMSDKITDAGERNNHVKQDRKRKIGSLTMDAVEKQVGKSMEQASKSLGVSRTTLRRFCREHGVSSWPLQRAKKNLQRRLSSEFSNLAFAVFLVTRIKRWSCTIKCHGFSAKWWRCGKHSYLPSKSDCIYKAVRLILQLRRWKYKKLTSSLLSSDLPAVSESTTKPRYTLSPSVVTVKATFNDDIIKFQFHRFSGLSELEQEVARRIKVNSSRLLLTYPDEYGGQLILVDDDHLRSILGFADDRGTIKLIIRQ